MAATAPGAFDPGDKLGQAARMSFVRTALARLRPHAARWRALASDPRARSEWLTRLRYGAKVHQDISTSYPDRYPRLFAAARDLLADRPALRILSFGCAAGEEVVTLRSYFPDATLIGAEINPALLRACHKLPPDDARAFIPSSSETIAAHGPYDAVFAMAVFTRRPHDIDRRGMDNIAAHYPFAPYAADLRLLAEQIAPGGLLIVEHVLYLVEDALATWPQGAQFVPVGWLNDKLARGPRFAPDGRLITPRPRIARIFRRTEP